MTPMIKAPDLGVVKSLAKALRAQLPKTAQVSHSKALEIAANSFGFSSWHACRSHFDRLVSGAFDPPEDDELLILMEDHPIQSRALLNLREEKRQFRHNDITVQGGVSAGRSSLGFLLPLIEIGARLDRDPGEVLNSITDPAFRVFLSASVNRHRPMRRWDRSYEAARLEGMVLTGSTKLDRIICVRNGRIPALLERGLGAVRTDPELGAVNLSRLIAELREGRGYPNEDITYAVEFRQLLDLTRLCQAQMNADSDRCAGPEG